MPAVLTAVYAGCSPACCIADHVTSKKNITQFDRLQESKENN